MPAPDAVIAAAEAHFEETLKQLEALARVPSVSAAGFDPAEVDRSAEAVAALFRELGLEGIEVLRAGDSHPYVLAEWRGAGPDAPTALLYAHHDVQPPGRESHWHSPPFEPTRRGDRIYGRGIVDGLILKEQRAERIERKDMRRRQRGADVAAARIVADTE